jgi:quinolinate synthase
MLQAATDLAEKIIKFKKEKKAVVLAHNYQLPEVQDIADFVGDSLALSQIAAGTAADTIVFCGVHFMAETAAIICPEKQVLIPDPEAGCSLASSINAAELVTWIREHPNAIVVSYINTTAEVKALSDYCCTSSNAVRVVNSIPADKEILFLPDMFLGSYVADITKRKNMFVWPGECHVHAGIRAQDINQMLKTNQTAELLIHPECGCTSSTIYDIGSGQVQKNAHILSTEGMMKYVRSSNANQFLIATETGILHRMRKENTHKDFIPIKNDAVCKYMKKITLEKVYNSICNGVYEVKVPDKIADKARLSIQRMMELA